MTMSYGIVILLLLKISNISKGKTKLIKFPNLWIMPVLFMGMMLEDYGKQNFVYSSEMMLALAVFGIAGLCVGLIRGRSLKYERDTDEKMYYKESYLSLLIYILVIFAKWGLKFLGAVSSDIIAVGLMSFACGSLIGRCSYISYQYLFSESL
ncbi:MAG: DUF1453 family protein [Paenibacillaceae bacterium]|nr:DUF1453 family protein [Paenibacillaceae bacterium]